MKRRDFIKVVGGAAVGWPVAVRAQQVARITRIGFLSLGRGDDADASRGMLDGFEAGLRELGYTEGQNIVFERRFAGGNAGKLGGLAQELVERRVDAIVAQATPAARAAK